MNKDEAEKRITKVNQEFKNLLTRVAFPELYSDHKGKHDNDIWDKPIGGLGVDAPWKK